MESCPGGALLVALLLLQVSAALRVLPGASSNCSQQGLRCGVSVDNCMGSVSIMENEYIPSAPEKLEARWETHQDQRGDVFTVINAVWNMREDGSISHMRGTELHVLLLSTNQNLCVRYSFFQMLTTKNPARHKWSFSISTVVVDPGQTYLVSVFNIPKPELLHSGYDVSTTITVPDCQDPRVKITKFCIESGSLWSPNITEVMGPTMLSVGFSTNELAQQYRVLVSCQGSPQHKLLDRNNRTMLNVTFDTKDWPLSCCNVDVEIHPFFLQCQNDCTRHRKSFSISEGCRTTPATPSSSVPVATYALIGLGLLFLCAVLVYITYVVLKHPKIYPSVSKLTAQPLTGEKLELGSRPPKLLVIYSQDHPLYRAVVLQLCAFLKSKCGVDVLVDLLDTTMVGTVGPTRWLEWQRQRLEYPVDKVVILCSRGVQAKWRAMCGEEGVLLREDVLSPNDDMLVPFLNLFLPNMHRPAALGKYIVAYFEDISDERDVPSVFALGVKYRLMKHFEELFFRILEMEKYQPGKVNHIEGIGKEEFFNCCSGKALKDAIETFHAYQMENPRWFEDECVASEEEAVAKQNLLNKPLEIGPVHECIPVIREGPPIFIRHVDMIHDQRETSSVVEVEPRLNPASQQELCWLNEPLVNPPIGSVTKQQPHGGVDTAAEHVLAAGLLQQEPQPHVYQQWCAGVQGEPGAGGPVEDNEQEDRMLYVSCPWPEERLATPQFPSRADMENLQSLQLLLGGPQPVELEEKELLLQLSEKGPSAGSDQGYISKESSQRGGPETETDPLIALARLQDELFQTTLT